MLETKIAHLTDRGVVAVTGDDAQKFLQGLVTNDIDKLAVGEAAHAALLTPQGKILFDFFVLRTDDGYLIDVARDKAAELAKRLGFYKLRAKVVVEDRSDTVEVAAYFGDDNSGMFAGREGILFYADPRHAGMGWRFIAPGQFADPGSVLDKDSTEAAYHAHRIALGVPEGGRDFAFGDTFPHEANLDALHGVEFKKGCYVGQEVVSRMQHRGTARKRVVPVTSDRVLPATGSEIRAGTALLGTLGSTAGNDGLALIRLDRAAEAIAKGDPIMAGDIEITLRHPDWAPFDVPGSKA